MYQVVTRSGRRRSPVLRGKEKQSQWIVTDAIYACVRDGQSHLLTED